MELNNYKRLDNMSLKTIALSILLITHLTLKAQNILGKTFVSQALIAQGKKGLCEANICVVFRFLERDSVNIEWWSKVSCNEVYKKYEEQTLLQTKKFKYITTKSQIEIMTQMDFKELDFNALKGIYKFDEGSELGGIVDVEFTMNETNYENWKNPKVNESPTSNLLEGTWIDSKGNLITFKNGYSNSIELNKVIQSDKTVATWYEYKLEEKDTLSNLDWLGVYYCSDETYYLGLQPINPVNFIKCPSEIIRKYYHYIKISNDELVIYGTQVTPHPKDLEEIGETRIFRRKK